MAPSSPARARTCWPTAAAPTAPASNAPSHLNLDDVNRFINGKGMGHTPAGRDVPVLGVALLHALCHWGNHRKRLAEKFEQGFEFERLTYGGIID